MSNDLSTERFIVIHSECDLIFKETGFDCFGLCLGFLRFGVPARIENDLGILMSDFKWRNVST
jgi:hypothetical protein